MRVDVPAGRDGHGGASDGLSVAQHRLAGCDLPERHLVARRNGVGGYDGDAFHAQFRAGRDGHPRHRDIIPRVKMNRRVFRRRQLGDFEEHGDMPLPSG